MGPSFSVPPEFIMPRNIQRISKPRNKQNVTGLTITKLLHSQIASIKKKRKLLELFRLLFASRRQPRKSFKKLLRSKPERTNEKQQNKRAKPRKPRNALKKLLQGLKMLL